MDTGLFGPHSLTESTIDLVVQGTGPGAYALGEQNASGGLSVQYVGRSDVDLNGRLKDWVGSYKHFKYAFYPTPDVAYQKECRLYHDFGTSANQVHPARPQGSAARCAVCGS